MLIGYARVSTAEQETHLQRRALHAAGVLEIHEEKRSGADRRRPVLRAVIDRLQPGDTLVVFKLDRVARSLQHFLEVLAELEAKNVGFRSATEAIDTTTPAGRLMMQMIGAFAEFEREIIRERTRHGMRSAVERGVQLGRPTAIPRELHLQVVDEFVKGASRTTLARRYGCHLSSIKRTLRANGVWRA